MCRNITGFIFSCASILVALSAASAATMSPLVGFGGSDGWLAPGEGGYAFLGTGNNERGLAYGNGHVYLVSRTGGNAVRILNELTGADLGGLDMTGITGGTFAVSAAGVGDDGAIYVANLTTQSTTSPFKVYKWASEVGASTAAYSGDGGLAASRLGDDLAVTGSGSSTRIAAGYNSSPAVAGNNSYAIIDPTAGSATAIAFTGTPPNAGDFRLGITFYDAGRVLGTAGSSLYRNTTFTGSTGTLVNSPIIPDPAGATADRLLAVTRIAGIPILAVQSVGDSHVSIYDVTDPSAPIYLASGNTTSGTLTANGNGVGQLAWGARPSSDSQILYAMSTNQGIQAFTVSIPEPASVSTLAILFGFCAFSRRRA